MSKGKLFFYTVALIASFAVLTVFVLKKFHVQPLWRSFSIKTGSNTDIDIKKTIPEVSPSPAPTPEIRMPGGREDPFTLLPEEVALNNFLADQNRADLTHPVSGTADPPIPTPVPTLIIPKSVFPKSIHLRGIIIGDTPQAYIEENGEYQKIVAGDTVDGGKVLGITANMVTILWNGQEIALKPEMD